MEIITFLRDLRSIETEGWKVVISGDEFGDWVEIHNYTLGVKSPAMCTLSECNSFKLGANAVAAI